MTTQEVMVPGILVALKTHVRGGVEYKHDAVEEDEDGRSKRWQTTRLMDDPAERKAATEISKLCVRTSFGLLCRLDREAELDATVIEMRAAVTAWNQQAKHSFVHVSAIKGRIADSDEEAIRAILDEARDLLDQMDRGMTEANVKEIRDAAMRAKRLSEMMTDESADQVNAALTAAREAAKVIVKRGDDLNDRVTKVMVDIEREAFNEARFSFLDTVALAMPDALPSIDLQRGSALEIDDQAAAVA